MQKREGFAVSGAEYADLLDINQTIRGHAFDGTAAYRSGVDLARNHGVNNIILGKPRKLQGLQIFERINAHVDQFAPGHLKPAKCLFADRHQRMSGDIFKLIQIRMAAPGNNNRTKLGEIRRELSNLQGSEPRNSEGILEHDIVTGIGQNKIQPILLDPG